MANYAYVIPAYYNPLSLNDMMKGAELYKQAYNDMEEKYMDIADKAGQFKYLS